MRKTFFFVCTAVICAGLFGCKSETGPDTKLAGRLDPLLHSFDDSGAIYAARVIELPSGRELYSHRADEPMIPASNGKLANDASALDHFGPNHTFKTYLAIDGDDLWLIGSGDPGCGDDKIAERHGGSTTTMLDEFASALQSKGIKHIKGNLYFYDATFDKQRVEPSWSKSFLTDWYAAPVAGLNFNDNCVDVTVYPTSEGKPARYEITPPTTQATIVNNCTTGKSKNPADIDRATDANIYTLTGTTDEKKKLQSKPVTDPGMFFADALRTNLQSHGITIDGKTARSDDVFCGEPVPSADHIVAVHETSMTDVMWRINKHSQNLFAEAICKLQGRDWNVAHGKDEPGSWASGGQAIRDFLHRQKIDDSKYVIVDGSGLARGNRVTTRLISDLFAAMSRHKYAEAFRQSLSIAAVDGTIGKRMEDIKGRVFAKTGYIGGVRSLSGYVHTRQGKWLCFSIIYNQIPGSVTPFEGLQDNACRLMVEWPNVEKAELKPTTRPATRRAATASS
jgi:D-alanyl-D-alanine carboxypeptidase/D-alanyl-D-alanine-endopeptidase (penicillin-binding protein 4)